MPPTYQEILATLPRLSPAELEGVRRSCTASLALAGAGTSTPDEDWLLRGILAELAGRSVPVPRGFAVRGPQAFRGYERKAVEVRGALERAAPGLSLAELRVLGEVAGRELARYVTWKSTALDVLLENVDLVPQAMERAFPGYMASGLLGLVVRRSNESDRRTEGNE